MRFGDLLRVVGDEPVFESALLFAGDVDPADVQRQLSRWVQRGWLFSLRRGLYALAPPYRKTVPEPFLVANRLVRGSYVSLQSALAHHGVIPEHVPTTTSVTLSRPGRWETPLGTFVYQHLHPALFGGYRIERVGGAQEALVATSAKALADLVHLVPGADDPAYLAELRLDLARVDELTADWPNGRPKLERARRHLKAAAQAEQQA